MSVASRLLTLSGLVALTFAPLYAGSDTEPFGKKFSRAEVYPLVESIAEHLYPGSRIRGGNKHDEVLSFKVVRPGRELFPRLLFFGGGIGQISGRNAIYGDGGEYLIPELVVGIGLWDPETEEARCGYAIFEPTGYQQKLAFGGLKRLALGAEDGYTCLCGPVQGLLDLYGETEDEDGDGIHELVTKVRVANRRIDAENPPVFEGKCVLDLHRRDPLPLVRDGVEIPLSVDRLSLYLELSGVDEERIVMLAEDFDRRKLTFPSEIEFLSEKYPDLSLEKVDEEFEPGKTRIVGRIKQEYDVAQIMRDMMSKGFSLQPRTIKVDELGYRFDLTYQPPKED